MSSRTASTSQQTQSQGKPQLDVGFVWSGEGKWAFGLGEEGSCKEPEEKPLVVYGPAFTPGKVDEEYPLRVAENCPNRPDAWIHAKICNIDADKGDDFKKTILAFHPNVESFRVVKNKSPKNFMLHAWDYVRRQGVLNKEQYDAGRNAFCKCAFKDTERREARKLARDNGGSARRKDLSPERWLSGKRRTYK